MCLCISSAKATRIKEIQKVLAVINIAEILADYVIKKGVVKEDEREVYEYGFLVALEMLLCLITCFIISVFLHTIPEYILFFVVFIPLRSYAGGLHLDNYWSCFFLSCLTFFAIMILGKYLKLSIHVAFIILVLLEFAVYSMYPVENVNRVIDIDENKQFKKRLQQFLLVDGIIGIVCVIFDNCAYLKIIDLTFFMVVITMAIGKCKKKQSSIKSRD